MKHAARAGCTRKVRRLALGCALFAGGTTATSLASDSWEKVFESSSQNVHLAGALAGRGTEWTVGGVGIIATGVGSEHSQQNLDGPMIERFGVGPDGATYAVGSHGTIWRRVSKEEWKIEHQSRPAETKGKKPNEDLLSAVRSISYQGKTLLVAHGPTGTPVLVRSEKGTWEVLADPTSAKEVASLSIFGPKLDLPKNCVADSWRWINDRDGLALCRDGRAFTFIDGTLTPAGKAPKACKLLRTVVRRRAELFAACGKDGQVVKYVGGAWTPVTGVQEVFALAANEECLIAATKRDVWQHCLPGSKAGDAGASRR